MLAFQRLFYPLQNLFLQKASCVLSQSYQVCSRQHESIARNVTRQSCVVRPRLEKNDCNLPLESALTIGIPRVSLWISLN